MKALPNLHDYASLLVVKPSSMGDIIHTLPAVHAIKTAHPHLHLQWIAKPEWLPLLEGNPDVDACIAFPQAEFKGMAGKAKLAAWAVRWNRSDRIQPEMVLDFQGLARSAMISVARGSRPVIGLSDAREGATLAYEHAVPVSTADHAVDRYLALPRALGVPVTDIAFPLPAGVMMPDLPTEPYVLIHPWSRGAGKSLGTHELQVLCDCLTTVRVVIAGYRKDPPTLRGRHVIDLTNRTSLPQLIDAMRRAAFVISVDSGPMHLAAALHTRVLGIHTWSDPRLVGPYPTGCAVWKAGRIASRHDLTVAECLRTDAPAEGDTRRMADFAMRAMG
jgi:heptosyltransferase I